MSRSHSFTRESLELQRDHTHSLEAEGSLAPHALTTPGDKHIAVVEEPAVCDAPLVAPQPVETTPTHHIPCYHIRILWPV